MKITDQYANGVLDTLYVITGSLMNSGATDTLKCIEELLYGSGYDKKRIARCIKKVRNVQEKEDSETPSSK